MKKLLKLSLMLLVGLNLCACGTTKTPSASGPKLLRLTAYIDGSGRFVFTPRSVTYQHRSWGPPKDVTFDDAPWPKLDTSPAGWATLGSTLDLSSATIVQRKGRDIIALEHTAGGFDLYFADAPNGGADYEVTLSIPRRK